MQAHDIMTQPVVMFRLDTPVLAAAAVLRVRHIIAAPVVDHDDKLIGMVTNADLIVPRLPGGVCAHSGKAPSAAPAATQTVGQVMTTTVIAMSPSADIAHLARAMFEYELHSIPIVIGSTVVGIVTWRDLLRTLVPDDDVIRAESHQPAEDLCRR